MTVDELRAALATLPGDMPVILQADDEGNDYSPAAAVQTARYVAANTWEGERYDNDEPAPATAQAAVFITPTR